MLDPEDRLEIMDLVARADLCATERRPEAYVALFTADAVMDGAKGRYRGADEIEAAVKAVWAGEAADTRHLTTSIVISSEGDTSEVEVSSILLLVTASPLALVAIASVRQAVRREDGVWRIARRTIS